MACADKRRRGSGRNDEHRRKCRLQRVRRSTAPRHDNRQRRRPFQPGCSQRFGDVLDSARKASARGAAVEMRAEKRRLELRKLSVDPQRYPPPRALTALCVCGHSTVEDAAAGHRLVPV